MDRHHLGVHGAGLSEVSAFFDTGATESHDSDGSGDSFERLLGHDAVL
jgi:hypothetical protein